MKYITLTALKILTQFSIGQSLQPIIYQNSGWTYVGYILGPSQFPEVIDIYKCYFDGDTSLNFNVYNKMYTDIDRTIVSGTTSQLASRIYIGGMRNDGDLYYFLHRDSIIETIIYDFSKVNIGDTIPAGFYSGLGIITIEDAYEVVMEDGELSRRLDLDYPFAPVFSAPNFINEGIGFLNGLIPASLFGIQTYSGGLSLYSYCLNGILVYRVGITVPSALPCDYTVGTEQFMDNKSRIEIFPNPIFSGDILNVKGIHNYNDKRAIIGIWDISGTNVYSHQLTNSSDNELIHIPNLCPGLYFLNFTINGDNFSTKLLIQ